MNTEGIFSSLRKTSVGLSTEMRRLEVIAENIANAESVPGENGKVYKRKIVNQSGASPSGKAGFSNQLSLKLNRTKNEHLTSANSNASSSKVTDDNKHDVIEIDDVKLVHNPFHPRADKNGFVRMPNINIVEEMVDLMSATRAYEANVSVMDATKSMIKKTFEI